MRMLTTPYWTTRSLASDVSSMFAEMDRLAKVYDERDFSPACEIVEADNHFYMSMDLPGLKKEDVKIDITENVLTVSGERKRETNSSDSQKFQLFERRYGYFKRCFTLPSSVNTSQVEARYENGVLELYIPKLDAAKPRQIQIQTGKTGIFERLLGNKKSDDIKDVNVQ
ncbi:Hsp20/alpha crystallin family protein [Bdellovibrio sp. SKB1291214]|uniref:Hsp20/alpha crystallin family protein n=1 Tax=Bdellovibrio sp. SKB1291214 TaxID=1732569 RepID=UPI000B51634E|nr:Hsp20/alpha crystallin family protein [Bdellovibrio sp. SKB1291214]UYL08541.1 Hsp20/alpha crystallin family protein [Bdellovibrio sp. SKB1291214]